MPWITPIVFKQAPEEPLTRLPRFDDGPRAISFRHIVHAYRDRQIPQNTEVQAITFQSMCQAAQYASPDYDVSSVAVTFPDDVDLVPSGIVTAPPLSRVVGDLAQFRVPRQLPLLFDVLKLGISAELPAKPSTASDVVDYVIVTNSDIHVQPPFYRVLATLIAQGYDVLTVNRRTLDVAPEERTFSPLFLADQGQDHPGFDCFVFPRKVMDTFVTSYSCCGAGMVMRSLVFNLVAHARRFLMLGHVHLTYHLGDDRVWNAAPLTDYIEYNIAQGRAVLAALAQDPDKAHRLSEFVSVHEPPDFAPPWSA